MLFRSTTKSFARLSSAGSATGSVVVATPDGTSIASASATPVEPAGLPAGSEALTGSLDYTVTNVTPGGSVTVTVALPAGSGLTGVGKLVGGTWVDLSSDPAVTVDTVNGTITLDIVDGGPLDEDGAVNGQVVDPLVPIGPCDCEIGRAHV